MKRYLSELNRNSISPYNNCFDEKNFIEGSFREAIWPILSVGQAFGLMPVCNLSSKSISKLQFKWISKRTLHSLFVATILFIYVLIISWSTILSRNFGFAEIALHVFYDSNVFNFFCFLALATKWPWLMTYWTSIERKLPTFRNLKQKRRYIWKIRIVAFAILIFALFEHIILIASHIDMSLKCDKGKDPLLSHVNANVPFLYTNALHISIPEAICVKMIGVTVTFVWVYMDVFIMTIGFGLSTQFKLFNDELKRTRGEQEFWAFRRVQFGKLRELTNTVDKFIGHFVLLSYGKNLFFICKLLFQTVRPPPTTFRMVFQLLSVALMIFRASVASFALSNLNDESKRPIELLRFVPAQSWNMETERFMNEINDSNIALSGIRFFSINRKMILSVVGTIVTFELILLQFNLKNTDDATC